MRIALIGVPFNSAGLPNGEARAPAALRDAGLFQALERSTPVFDRGDISLRAPFPDRDPATGIIAPRELAEMVAAVQRDVGRTLGEELVPLVIGGECPLLLGCLAAARDAYGQVGLLFVDGHEDAWPPRHSTTGEAADMELGLALGLTKVDNLDDLARLLPLVQPDATIVLGPRDRDELATVGIDSIASVVTFRDDASLLRGDLATVVAPLVRHLHATVGRWWFHLDLDVLSTASLAAIRYPQPGGLTWDHVETISAIALRTPGLVGWDVTIYNPDLDPRGAGARRIVSFLETALRDLN